MEEINEKIIVEQVNEALKEVKADVLNSQEGKRKKLLILTIVEQLGIARSRLYDCNIPGTGNEKLAVSYQSNIIRLLELLAKVTGLIKEKVPKKKADVLAQEEIEKLEKDLTKNLYER